MVVQQAERSESITIYQKLPLLMRGAFRLTAVLVSLQGGSTP